jgi:hypothetical protein
VKVVIKIEAAKKETKAAAALTGLRCLVFISLFCKKKRRLGRG